MTRFYPEIETLVASALQFHRSVRNRAGFKEAEFQALCDAIRVCATRWADEVTVPKMLPGILVNYSLTITLLSDQYADNEAERLREAARTIQTLAGQCFKGSFEDYERYGVFPRHAE